MKTCMSHIFYHDIFPYKLNIMTSTREIGWIFNTGMGVEGYCSNDWHIRMTFISIQGTKDSLLI